MALKDRLRRFARSDRSSSTSSRSNSTSLSHTATVPPPSTVPLQKSSSRLHLSKTFTAFSSHHKKSSSKNKIEQDPETQRRAIEEWRKKDEAEWRMPTARRPGRKSQKHQDVLRAFEWGFGGRKSGEGNGRCGSVWSGVSPGTSRVGSVDDGGVVGRVLSAGSRRERGSVAVGRVEEE